MLGSEYFMNDCYFSWVKHYLGPEGTQREDDPAAFRDFAIEDLVSQHVQEEGRIAEKLMEKDVTHMEIEKKYRDLKKLKLN